MKNDSHNGSIEFLAYSYFTLNERLFLDSSLFHHSIHVIDGNT